VVRQVMRHQGSATHLEVTWRSKNLPLVGAIFRATILESGGSPKRMPMSMVSSARFIGWSVSSNSTSSSGNCRAKVEMASDRTHHQHERSHEKSQTLGSGQ
jgi:hypothetical protein